MYEFRDLSRLTATASWVVGIYLVMDIVASTAAFLQPPDPDAVTFGAVEALVLGELVALITTFFVVGRWIYRASQNAHRLSDNMTISPGWAVGWYFVPLMNLFRPFQAMKETWFASHEAVSSYEEKTPSILAWWWGLWIVTNILGNVSFRMSMSGAADPGTIATVDLLAAGLNIPLCAILVMIMREISASQDQALHVHTFA